MQRTGQRLRACLRGVWRALGSLGLSCVLLLLLGLLTWLGTLEQVDNGLYEVQKKYFDSFVLVHDFGPVALPLPGAALVLSLLAVNLVIGGMLRLRKTRATLGVLIAHVGILLLLVAGFVKAVGSQEGHVTLFEGERASEFQSYQRWELAILERAPDGSVREHLVPQERFDGAEGDRAIELGSGDLPFRVELTHLLRNCRPLPKGPMFEVTVPVVDGFFLREEPRVPEAEANIAGVYATLVDPAAGTRQTGMLWGAARDPWTARIAGREWGLMLRKERYPLPFALHLDDFRKEDHPRTGLPKSFESTVTLTEGGATRPVRISMNEPLRTAGLVLYQASWGPSNARPGDPLFSTFAVVRNPADRLPLYACIVIAVGLVLHFSRKLSVTLRTRSKAT